MEVDSDAVDEGTFISSMPQSSGKRRIRTFQEELIDAISDNSDERITQPPLSIPRLVEEIHLTTKKESVFNALKNSKPPKCYKKLSPFKEWSIDMPASKEERVSFNLCETMDFSTSYRHDDSETEIA